ncbi:MAG: Ribonuclease protein component [Francisellaceae bacterium]|nr:Ribonuclease protein component [Francisellaceae bacterium]
MNSNCFPPSNRLLKPDDYQAVFAQPKCVRSPYFTLLAIKNNSHKARLGIIVAKRKVRLAVNRNALKRVVRESFRLHKTLLNGLDIVIILSALRPDNNLILFDNLRQKWQQLIK